MSETKLPYSYPYHTAPTAPDTKIYEIIPTKQFFTDWKKSDPNYYWGPENVNNEMLEKFWSEVQSGEWEILPISDIHIDIVNGLPDIQFVGGRHKFTNLAVKGITPIPVQIQSSDHNQLQQLSWLQPLSEKIHRQLQGLPPADDGMASLFDGLVNIVGLRPEAAKIFLNNNGDAGVLEFIDSWRAIQPQQNYSEKTEKETKTTTWSKLWTHNLEPEQTIAHEEKPLSYIEQQQKREWAKQSEGELTKWVKENLSVIYAEHDISELSSHQRGSLTKKVVEHYTSCGDLPLEGQLSSMLREVEQETCLDKGPTAKERNHCGR